jgi:hypothetical protein
MPVRLITADDWRPSLMMERRLLELEREGLLRRRTSLSSPEWIAPAADHREPWPPKGYVVSFTKFHRHGLGAPPSRFMRALCHHYGVELQHLSPNAITGAAVFAAVCEGYLGMMPHWELWLHLYRGELFNAPTGTTGVRKPVRAGCLNLVLKTGKTERPREYIPVGLSTNHAGWDSQWFYLRNDDDLLPAYTGRLITERPENWTYDVVQVHQSRLDPLLDALKKLRVEGLTAALVLSAVYHRRVLPLMSRPLRMDEMGPGVSSQDLEACRMSNEAPANDEVAARVRAAVAGDFQSKHVNGFPMRPDEGSIDLVSFLSAHGFDSGSPSISF